MLVSTKAIVLNRIKFSDTSLIVKVYSQGFGLKTLFVKGARKSKNNNQQTLFQPFNVVDIIFFQKKNTQMGSLRSASHAIGNTLIFDLSKSTIAVFLAEILLRYIKEEEQNEELFSFIYNQIIQLIEENNSSNINNFTLFFLFSLMSLLGIEPQGTTNDKLIFCLEEGCFFEIGKCKKPLEPERNLIFYKFIASANSVKISFSKQERRIILRVLLEYFDVQLSGSGKIKSLDVFEEIAF